ncbi:MAG: putative XRE-type DNA-binding protein [Vicingaceae bacterium]|jgi:predicted XRE-type DNA-binding protein
MKASNNIREKVLSSTSYWVEAINGKLYNAIVEFMENNDMKQKDLAKHLEITPGRVSQILNDGEINFSIEKVVDIALKIDKIPSFGLEEKSMFIKKELENSEISQIHFSLDSNDFYPFEKKGAEKCKVISLNSYTEEYLQLAY